jgi:hypothetical protein
METTMNTQQHHITILPSTINDEEDEVDHFAAFSISIDKPMRKIAVFDFDDTLFPTSYLTSKSKELKATDISEYFKCLDDNDKEKLKLLDQQLVAVFKKLQKADYELAIITNSYNCWASIVIEHFFPLLHQFSDQYRVISSYNKNKMYGFVMKSDTFARELVGKYDFVLSIGEMIEFKAFDQIILTQQAHFIIQRVTFINLLDIDKTIRRWTNIDTLLNNLMGYIKNFDIFVA